MYKVLYFSQVNIDSSFVLLLYVPYMYMECRNCEDLHRNILIVEAFLASLFIEVHRKDPNCTDHKN